MFGSDVTGGAEDRQRPSELAGGVEPFGEAEVAHEGFAAGVEENVPRFEVAVEDAFGVGILNGTRDFGDKGNALARVVSQGRADFL